MIKILVVDDDDDLLEMVTLLLQSNKMEVTSLRSGGSLFETIQQSSPDVLLMDIFLGDADGRQLCRELKNAAWYSGFPVLLYSAGEISSASIVDSAANHFLRKPFNMQQLVNLIHNYTKQ